MYIIYGSHIKSDNKKNLCIWKKVVVWCCVVNRSCDIISVRVHCVDMTDISEWLKRRSENCRIDKIIHAGRTRTYEDNSNWFRINRLNHSATAPFPALHINIYHHNLSKLANILYTLTFFLYSVFKETTILSIYS